MALANVQTTTGVLEQIQLMPANGVLSVIPLGRVSVTVTGDEPRTGGTLAVVTLVAWETD